MEAEQILELMRGYFSGKESADTLAALPDLQPRQLLKESLDYVDFVVYLEEELDREIDISQVGAALQNLNFRELSAEVSRMLETA